MLSLLLDSIKFPAVIFDLETKKVMAVNGDAELYFGPDAGTLIGTSVARLLMKKDRVRLFGHFAESSDHSQADLMLPSQRRHELRLLVESSMWNGRPAGFAVLCDIGGERSWAHPVSIGQGQLAASVVESALEAIIVINEHGVIQSTNAAADAMFGYPRDQLVGRAVEILMPHSTALQHSDFIRGASKRGISQPGRPRLFRSVRKSGQEFDTAVSLTQLSGYPVLFCAVLRDVTGDRLEQQRLEQMALTDQITGLANRRTFEDWWNELNGIHEPVALLLIELQRMSILVEGFGQRLADEVLAAVGGCLERTAASVGARVARSDAGQFLVIALNHERAAAERLAESFHDDSRGEIDAIGVLFHPVLNIGVALRHGTDDALASVMAEASAALASVSRDGVGQTSFGDSSAQSRAARELTMETALRKALDAGEIVAVVQPIYRIRDGCIIGAEKLARWTWGDQVISPATFVGLAERTGLINTLSSQMRQQAFADIPGFIAAAGDNAWCTWINISPRELVEANFGDRFLTELQAAKVDPTRIGIEITETAWLTNPKTVEATLRDLRLSGVRVALDDFGTGFSSLSVLKDIEADVVKIDRSFTKTLPMDHRVAAIVSGTISAVSAMGSEVVAEGIETVEQLEWFAESGCHFAQGFLLSAATTASEILQLMEFN